MPNDKLNLLRSLFCNDQFIATIDKKIFDYQVEKEVSFLIKLCVWVGVNLGLLTMF